MKTIYNRNQSNTMQSAIFLDRDGTINVEKNYLYRIEDWEWIPGAQAAIKKFKELGYRVIVVSNQAGIARGFYGSLDVDHLHAYVQQELHSLGTSIDAFYYCPHHPEYGLYRSCECRKPKPGMLLSAAKELNINLEKSWMLGDKYIDLLAAHAAGVRGALVQTGYGKQDLHHLQPEHMTVADLPTAVSMILQDANSDYGMTR